mgnify:CR=1 FL=1
MFCLKTFCLKTTSELPHLLWDSLKFVWDNRMQSQCESLLINLLFTRNHCTPHCAVVQLLSFQEKRKFNFMHSLMENNRNTKPEHWNIRDEFHLDQHLSVHCCMFVYFILATRVTRAKKDQWDALWDGKWQKQQTGTLKHCNWWSSVCQCAVTCCCSMKIFMLLQILKLKTNSSVPTKTLTLFVDENKWHFCTKRCQGNPFEILMGNANELKNLLLREQHSFFLQHIVVQSVRWHLKNVQGKWKHC